MAIYPEFEGKTVIVTGGSTGIGRATALEFAANGAQIVIADVNADAGTALVDGILSDGGTALFVHTDVSDEAAVNALVQTTVDHFGKLDFAFNNAGISGEITGTHETALTAWQRIIDINLTGVWLCMRAELQAMLQTGGGAIVNTSSVLGIVGTLGLGPYVAAKHGVMGITKVAAQEYARQNIRVNCINPGWVQTNMTSAIGVPTERLERLVKGAPAGRWGQPKDIAGAVLWLCSDAAAFVTASAFVLDGGLTSI